MTPGFAALLPPHGQPRRKASCSTDFSGARRRPSTASPTSPVYCPPLTSPASALAPGLRLRLTASTLAPAWDHVLYLVTAPASTCALSATPCLDSSDVGGAGTNEQVQFTNIGNTTRTVFIFSGRFARALWHLLQVGTWAELPIAAPARRVDAGR